MQFGLAKTLLVKLNVILYVWFRVVRISFALWLKAIVLTCGESLSGLTTE